MRAGVERIARLARIIDGELGGHGLAHDDAARLATQRDARRIAPRTMSRVDGRAVRRRHVEGIDDVLHADRARRRADPRRRSGRARAPARWRDRRRGIPRRRRLGSRSAMRSRQARVTASQVVVRARDCADDFERGQFVHWFLVTVIRSKEDDYHPVGRADTPPDKEGIKRRRASAIVSSLTQGAGVPGCMGR